VQYGFKSPLLTKLWQNVACSRALLSINSNVLLMLQKVTILPPRSEGEKQEQ